MERDIFISYASADLSIAKKLSTYFKKHGRKCYIAPRNIHPRKTYEGKVIEDIMNCNVIIFIYSKYSNHSLYVERELATAVKKAIPIITYCISKDVPTKAIKQYLCHSRRINAYYGPNLYLFYLYHRVNKQLQGHKSMGRNMILCCFTLAFFSVLFHSMFGPMEAEQMKERIFRQDIKNESTVQTFATNSVEDDIGIMHVDKSKKSMQNLQESRLEQSQTNDPSTNQSSMERFTTNQLETQLITSKSLSQIKVGDILQFGTYRPRNYLEQYDDEDLLWIVLEIKEETKELVLLSKYIIDIMPFDVAESGVFNKDKSGADYNFVDSTIYSDRKMTEFRGNSDWEYSNLRTFLNTSSEYVFYKDKEPVSLGTDESCNGYEKQPGFLYRFNTYEQDLIVMQTNRTAVNCLCNGTIVSGELLFDYHPGDLADFDLSNVKKKETKDYVFLLSLEEVITYAKTVDFLYTTPTKSAIRSDASTWYKTYTMNESKTYLWALRTPIGKKSYSICAVTGNELGNDIFLQNASSAGLGIRPAMVINPSNYDLLGNGTEQMPYVFVRPDTNVYMQ